MHCSVKQMHEVRQAHKRLVDHRQQELTAPSQLPVLLRARAWWIRPHFFLGSVPVFWDRYFTSVSTTGIVEYRHMRENPVLRAKNIRVLAIARQTKRVNGTGADGTADGQANAEDVITTFGKDLPFNRPTSLRRKFWHLHSCSCCQEVGPDVWSWFPPILPAPSTTVVFRDGCLAPKRDAQCSELLLQVVLVPRVTLL
jgi:hypothetical protein